MAINLDRKTPGIFGILIGATLSIVLGAILAVVNLAAQTVEVVSAPPKETVEGARLFIQGNTGGGTKSWERKRDIIDTGPGEVGFTERELNGWAGATFRALEIKKEEKEGSVMIIAGPPNFRLVGQELQVGSVNTVNFFGAETPLVLQARGTFVRSNPGVVFQPNEAYLGALPLHRIPVLMTAVAERFGAGRALPSTVEKILGRASDISVVENELVVRMP